MAGPFEDKENAEVKSPNGRKRGPKTEGKILITESMLRFKRLIVSGLNTSRLISDGTDHCVPSTCKVLERMYRVGMIDKENISKHKRAEYKYTINNEFSENDSGIMDPIR